MFVTTLQEALRCPAEFLFCSKFVLLRSQSLILQAALTLVCCCLAARAQSNYEIQVYGSETVAPGRTMIEIHSNFTVEGSSLPSSTSPSKLTPLADGTLPTKHQLHETLEITQGWNDWFETGFYVFTSAGPREGYKWVGDHIRPRVRVPESWRWPLGVSLSMEMGYQRRIFSPDTWTWEIRPIVDKQLGRWYLAFNPALDRSWHGPSVSQGFSFSPNFKASYNVTRKLQAGLEYYSSMGDITGFDPLYLQQQQFFPSIDYDFGPNWEFNFGVGLGVTRTTDHLIVKAIIGRRFRFITPRLPQALRRFSPVQTTGG